MTYDGAPVSAAGYAWQNRTLPLSALTKMMNVAMRCGSDGGVAASFCAVNVDSPPAPRFAFYGQMEVSASGGALQS